RGAVYSPSACPRAASSSAPSRATNSENLRLDEPAFRTAIASVTSTSPSAGYLPARSSSRDGLAAAAFAPELRDEHCDRAGSKPRRHRIGAARQNDRHARAEHDPGSIGLREE